MACTKIVPYLCVFIAHVNYGEDAVSRKVDSTVLVLSGFDDSVGTVPFDYWNTQLNMGRGSLNYEYIASPKVQGNGAMKITYLVEQSETWGGFVAINHVVNESYLLSGASHISFWYNVQTVSNSSGRVHFRLILFDGSHCISNCAHPEGDTVERYYSFHHILHNSPGWKQVSIELIGSDSNTAPFRHTGWSGIAGNRKLDLFAIKGFGFEISMDGFGDIGSKASGVLLLDGLECTGERILQAVLDLGSWNTSVSAGIWWQRFYNSRKSEALTQWSFEDCPLHEGFTALRGSFMVQQSETWGGFLDIGHLVPGIGYYNMSGSEEISLWYRIPEATKLAGRTGLRLILLDGSGCLADCSLPAGQAPENYYSFHPVLDEVSGWIQIKVKLEGSDSDTAPFWRTGWTGEAGNRVLDKENLKGFRLELNIDGAGGIGSNTSGTILYDDISGLALKKAAPEIDPTVLVMSGFDDSVGVVPSNYWHIQLHQGRGSLSHEYIASPKVHLHRPLS